MRTSRTLSSIFLSLAAVVVLSTAVLGADPGAAYTLDGAVSDQKAGSVLFFNYYSSSASSNLENTKINITNTSPTSPVIVHMFFIDGATCTPADYYICMTQNQTYSFTASDFDPGTTGYVVAIASGPSGCPIAFNALIGDEYIKLASGHVASIGAVAAAALSTPDCDETLVTNDLNFDGVEYDRLPSVIAADNIPSLVDGNETMIIINRPSGDFVLGADTIDPTAGLLFNDEENAYSFSIKPGLCQFKFIWSNSFPRTVPRFTTIVPTGRTGWMKLYNFTGAPMLGVVLNNNPSAAAFKGGRNMHNLKLTSSRIAIPIFPSNCR